MSINNENKMKFFGHHCAIVNVTALIFCPKQHLEFFIVFYICYSKWIENKMEQAQSYVKIFALESFTKKYSIWWLSNINSAKIQSLIIKKQTCWYSE